MAAPVPLRGSRLWSRVPELWTLGLDVKETRIVIVMALLAGCVEAPRPFVQGNIQIYPPVTRLANPPVMSDGGTQEIGIRDAKGRGFTYFVDHRLGGSTPGAIYLNAYPGESNSIRVLDVRDFNETVGNLEYHRPNNALEPTPTAP